MSNLDDAAAPFRRIAEQGDVGALSMVAAIMEQNARDSEWVSNALVSSLEADRDRWMERALRAEYQVRKLTGKLDFVEMEWDD